MSKVANIVLVLALLPYVSPLPIRNMDVQLTADGAAILVVLLLSVVEPSRITICKEDLVVLAIGLFMLFYVDFAAVPMSFAWLRNCGTVLFCFPVYFAVRNLYRYMSSRVFCAVIVFYLMVIILEAVSPSFYISTFARTLSDVRLGGTGGLNGLTPEPSYMGDLSVLFCVSLYFFHPDFWRKHRAAVWLIVISSAAMIIISQSATGAVLGVVVALLAGLASPRPLKIKLAYVTVLLALLGVSGEMLAGSQARGGLVLASILNRPAAALNDLSLIERFGAPLVSVLQLSSAPFGTGQLSPEPKLVDSALDSGVVDALWPDPMAQEQLLEWLTYSDVGSGLGFTIQRMGLFSLLLLSVLLSLVRGFRGQWVVRIFLIAYILNASLFIPTLWFVIGCCVAAHRSGLSNSVRADCLRPNQ